MAGAGTKSESSVSATPSIRTVDEAGLTRPVTHRFINCREEAVALLWVDHEGEEKLYATIQPRRGRHTQPTYNTHPWAFRLGGPDGRLLTHYVGEGAEITFVSGRDEPDVGPYKEQEVVYETVEWGKYRKRAESMGIPIMAFDVVGDDAVQEAARVLRMLLAHVPQEILRRLQETEAALAIIGRTQQTTDIPAHQYLKGSMTADGRCFDEACRGLGGRPDVPTTSVGEENCTMIDDSRYPMENILVHEFAHAVMDLGMSKEERQRVVMAFEAAKENGLYEADCYMMYNAEEYWAEAVQAWFHATERIDVNSGISTRALLQAHDEKLAAIIERTFGKSNHWRYTDDAPGTLKKPSGGHKRKNIENSAGLQEPERIVTIGGLRPSSNPLEHIVLRAVQTLGETVCCFATPRRGTVVLSKDL